MARDEELLELLILVGHRARLALDQVCAGDERTGSEVLMLRVLGRFAHSTSRRRLADALGWNVARVTQVVGRLVDKEYVRRLRGHSLTGAGTIEAAMAREFLRVVEEPLVDGFSHDELATFLDSLRRIADNSERLPRLTRSAS